MRLTNSHYSTSLGTTQKQSIAEDTNGKCSLKGLVKKFFCLKESENVSDDLGSFYNSGTNMQTSDFDKHLKMGSVHFMASTEVRKNLNVNREQESLPTLLYLKKTSIIKKQLLHLVGAKVSIAQDLLCSYLASKNVFDGIILLKLMSQSTKLIETSITYADFTILHSLQPIKLNTFKTLTSIDIAETERHMSLKLVDKMIVSIRNSEGIGYLHQILSSLNTQDFQKVVILLPGTFHFEDLACVLGEITTFYDEENFRWIQKLKNSSNYFYVNQKIPLQNGCSQERVTFVRHPRQQNIPTLANCTKYVKCNGFYVNEELQQLIITFKNNPREQILSWLSQKIFLGSLNPQFQKIISQASMMSCLQCIHHMELEQINQSKLTNRLFQLSYISILIGSGVIFEEADLFSIQKYLLENCQLPTLNIVLKSPMISPSREPSQSLKFTKIFEKDSDELGGFSFDLNSPMPGCDSYEENGILYYEEEEKKEDDKDCILTSVDIQEGQKQRKKNKEQQSCVVLTLRRNRSTKRNFS